VFCFPKSRINENGGKSSVQLVGMQRGKQRAKKERKTWRKKTAHIFYFLFFIFRVLFSAVHLN